MIKHTQQSWPRAFAVLCASALIACLGLSAPEGQAADPAPEDVVKAAVVFKLTKFVEWPERIFAASRGVLRICAIGDTPVAEALTVVEGRVSQGRTVEFLKVDAVAAKDACHLLFIGKREAARARTAEEDRFGLSLLTVSDSEGFASNGGIVELTRRGSRLGFRVNVKNAQRAGLTISAPLLELAEIVE